MTTPTTIKLKLLFAAHHYVFKSTDPLEIAEIINVSHENVNMYFDNPSWDCAVAYWKGNPTSHGDLNLVEKYWTEIFETGNITVLTKDEGRFINTPYLFTYENLSEAEIHERITEEKSLVRYQDLPACQRQDLRTSSRWWVYPNFQRGIYSKVYARVNIGNMIVAPHEKQTFLVAIENDTLTLLDKISDNVVHSYDQRLFVCL